VIVFALGGVTDGTGGHSGVRASSRNWYANGRHSRSAEYLLQIKRHQDPGFRLKPF